MYDCSNILLTPEVPMSVAIQVLEREALRITLVVDEKNTLLGTVTDGDIRRALIRHQGMETPIGSIMSGTPTVAKIDDDRDVMLQMMKAKDLLQVPIVDADNHVVGLETLQHLTSPPTYENPVFLMAGGFGKRLRPLTFDVPKPMLRIGEKPILESILERFVESGFRNFFISIHYKAEMVRDYFGNGDKWGVTIQYVHESEPLGTAGALGLLPCSPMDLPVLMMNGDLLTNVDFADLLRFHCENGGLATMCVREFDFEVPYGVIEADNFSIRNIVEKPVHRFFVNAGIYVLQPELVQMVEGDEYLDMPDLLGRQIAEGRDVVMFPVHEYWLDIGKMDDFRKAQEDSQKR